MTTIVGIAGSLRKKSWNKMLLQAAAEVAPAGTSIQIASIDQIPVYNYDVEVEGIPAPVASLKEQIAKADALFLVTPEYNNSIPGVLKNAIDWLSRPSADIKKVFGDKPVGLIGTTEGKGGTRLSQVAWLPVFRNLTMRPFFGKVIYLSEAPTVFNEKGQLTDEKTRAALTKYLHEFSQFISMK